MKNNDHETPSVENLNYKFFDRGSDKYFYAAYLNVAKQNVFIVFRDVSESLNLRFDEKVDDDLPKKGTEIWRVLKNNEKPEESQKVIERLKMHFSFLEPLAINHVRNKSCRSEIEPIAEDYHDVLLLWVKSLFSFRDMYSHTIHNPVDLDPAVLDGLRTMYYYGWQDFKRHKGLNDDDVKHLDGRDKEGNERKGFRYAFVNENGLTEKGFLYFVCLWLEKRDAQEFLKSHKGFKRGESKSQKATLEKFTYFRTRLPKPRLVSDNSMQGLFMDIANELKRCPKELYYLLAKNDQGKFKHTELNDLNNDTNEYENEPVLKRHSNRFYYFAMRYLDSSFDHIKFHIDLGNYCFNSYDQTIEDVPRKRRWIRKMTAFGNLVDFDDHNQPEAWKNKLEKREEKGRLDTYITDTTPHYHFDPDSDVMSIGMKWVAEYNKSEIWPDITKGSKPGNEAPDYWLSLYELPGVVFYQMLHLQNNTRVRNSAEDVIRSYGENITSFLDAIESGSVAGGLTRESLITLLKERSLQLKWMPKAIVNFLLSKESQTWEEKAKVRLEKYNDENRKLLSSVTRQSSHYKQKPGSKDYILMKSGNMADFLARDMIDLQKAINGDQGKANGTEFQILQAKLAYFGKNKDTLVHTFQLCNLIKSSNPHPFLFKMEMHNYRGILEFYSNYLSLRQGYLQQCLREKDYENYHFLKLGSKGGVDINDLIKKQRSAVMNLPRGLFKTPILNALKSSNTSRELVATLEGKERLNESFIIKSYFEQIKQDQNQDFYGYNRNYELLDELYDKRSGRDKKTGVKRREKYSSIPELVKNSQEIQRKLKETIIEKCKEKNADERSRIKKKYREKYRKFTENEKQIRLFKTCDIVLFSIIDQIYRKGNFLFDRHNKSIQIKEIGLSSKYKLKEIKPNAERSILSEQVRVELLYPGKEKKFSKMIVKEQLKIKNYGDFRGLLKDRRVEGMLPFIDTNTIQFEAVKMELYEFHEARFLIFDSILAFEKKAVEVCQIEPNEYGFRSHEYILKKLSEEVPSMSEEQIGQMSELRNMVCHSQYPTHEMFKSMVDGSRFNELAQYVKGNELVKEFSIAIQLKKLAVQYYQKAIDSLISN